MRTAPPSCRSASPSSTAVVVAESRPAGARSPRRTSSSRTSSRRSSRESSSSRPSGRSRATARRARSRSSRSARATSRSRWPRSCSAARAEIVVEARVGVGAVTDRPTRLPDVEALLVGSSGRRSGGRRGRARRTARRPAVHDARLRPLPPVAHRHARPAGASSGRDDRRSSSRSTGARCERRSSRVCC